MTGRSAVVRGEFRQDRSEAAGDTTSEIAHLALILDSNLPRHVAAPIETFAMLIATRAVSNNLDQPAEHDCTVGARKGCGQGLVPLRHHRTATRVLMPCDALIQKAHAMNTDNRTGTGLPALGSHWPRKAPGNGYPAPRITGAPSAATTGFELELGGPWRVSADGVGLSGRRISFDDHFARLTDVREREDVADFAGQLRYSFQLELDPEQMAAGDVFLDLGMTSGALSLQINGDTPWMRSEGPFVFEVTDRLVVGTNTVTIVVANLSMDFTRDPVPAGCLPSPGRSVNRLPAGLLGPVRLCAA